MATKIELGTDAQWGVKDGGVLAFNRENGVFKAIELASSRASGATYVAQSGLIADAEAGVPRIDWTNGVGELLLEPQSTNELTYSEDFSNASWLKINAGTGIAPVVTANYAISPDGTLNANRIQFDIASGSSSSDISQFQANVAETISNTYTTSIYLKSNDGNSYDMIFLGVAGGTQLITITPQWQRFETTEVAIGTTSFRLRLRGNEGTSKNADILAWGAQLEELSYATSYIRTEGSQVTRIADAVTGNSSLGQVINSSEGVLYVEMSALVENDSIFRNLSLSDGSSNNRVLFYYSTTANQIGFSLNSGGVSQGGDIHTLSSALDNIKIAIKYANNDLAFWVNGVEVSTDPLATMPTGLDKLSFDNSSTATSYGRIRELKVYDTALTDAQLTTLTTL